MDEACLYVRLYFSLCVFLFMRMFVYLYKCVRLTAHHPTRLLTKEIKC